jgi:hypothetical protein
MVDFKEINRAALQTLHRLLPEILPGGKFHGQEYDAGISPEGDRQLLEMNLNTRKWIELATGDSGYDVTSLLASMKEARIL